MKEVILLRKVFVTALVLVLAVASCSFADGVKIGSCIYRFNDAFMLRFRNAMTAESEKLGAEISMSDGQDDQNIQNGQIEEFLSSDVNVLIVNPVDRMSSQWIIDKAKAANIPVVFINREPTPEMLATYDKAYYVGAKAEESGTEAGNLIADYFKSHPEADKNHDGKLQFVLLRGQNGHQDMILRSKYSVEAIRNEGIEPVEIAGAIANWDKVQAMNIMNAFIMSIGPENIEAVIANNDEMALGAIEALKANDYNKGDPAMYIPVVGVDANASALDAMTRGEMLGTVLNDADGQGSAAVKLAVMLAEGKDVSGEVTDGKYIWVPYQKVTRGESK
ncbi:MAG: galactose ABC transporter substrate-binding protein [Synergistaceae bacterium]|nr:galactose ABC transporter substrate-binding protein [Synergistaceae bacterium]